MQGESVLVDLVGEGGSKVLLCDTCPCVEGVPTVEAECVTFYPNFCNNILPEFWEMVVPDNFTLCSNNCSGWSGTFIFSRFSTCVWRTPEFTSSGGQDHFPNCAQSDRCRYLLEFGTSPTNAIRISALYFTGNTVVGDWRIDGADFDCDGPNTLNFINLDTSTFGPPSGGACGSQFPETLTIEPYIP